MQIRFQCNEYCIREAVNEYKLHSSRVRHNCTVNNQVGILWECRGTEGERKRNGENNQ